MLKKLFFKYWPLFSTSVCPSTQVFASQFSPLGGSPLHEHLEHYLSTFKEELDIFS